MSTRIIVFLSVTLLTIVTDNSIYAQNLQSGGHVFFFYGKREYYQLYNLYSMEVWAYVPPGHRWQVGSTIINVEYNRDALRAVNSDTVWDAWPELQSKGYIVRQSDYGTATALSLSLFGRNYAVIQEGQAVRLGTLRWEVLDGSQQDGFSMRSDSLHPLVSVVFDSTFELKPFRDDFNARWTWRGLTPRIIDPATVACSSIYFRAPVCNETWEDTTQTPLQDGDMYWHRTTTPTGAGPHVVSYQADWSDSPIGTDRILHFLTQSLDSILTAVQCRWEKQLAPGDLEWRVLPNRSDGGIIRWSRSVLDFAPIRGEYFLAITLSALHPSDLTKIVAAGECGDGGSRFGMSTLLLNNSTEFYVANPHFRWTTDYLTCGFSPRCLDVESILLHEAGHYLGLGHQEQPLSVLWSGYDGANIHIHQCEANSVRRLYSPQLLTQTPVPPPNNDPCMGITDVEEQSITHIQVGHNLQVYPMPVTDGQLDIRMKIEKPTRVALSILDMTGRILLPLSSTFQQEGEQNYSFALHLASGVYFLRVETDTDTSLHKIVILQ